MGSKGSQTQTQNTQQTQTYTPAGSGYMTNALDRAGNTANLPFMVPQAPVAGFSQDQLGAFQQFRDLQGMAQPYYNQASNYFSPQGAQDFYNPYAANVTAGLKDIFGAQNAQTTGQLTQAAGGVGADRIAVGQAELARQQGLSAGQTLANIWGDAGRMAQSAGQGQMALGANAQNSALQGSNALLGTGGLQQQLTQAQMNSPYQQALAYAAFPYQQAQFLAGITGALAPGLGGTTQGWGTTTTTKPGPSLWSQLLGAGVAGVGAYNAFGGDSNSGSNNFNWASAPGGGYMPMAAADGGAVEGYDDGGAVAPPQQPQANPQVNPYAQMFAPMMQQYGQAIQQAMQPRQAVAPVQQNAMRGLGGFFQRVIPGWGGGMKGNMWGGHAEGGAVQERPYAISYDDGGGVERTGHIIPNSDPIDVTKMSLVPQVQLAPVQPHIPQVNLNPPPVQEEKSGNSDLSNAIKMGMQFAMMASDERLKENVRQVGKTNDGQNIYSYNYKGSPQTQMGLMAHEVERRHPEAVGEIGGYKAVDYAQATKHAAHGGRVDPYRHYGDEGDPGGVVPEEDTIYRMPDQPNGVNPYETWRKETPTPDFSGNSPTLNYADASAPPAVAAIDKAAPKVAAASPARNPNPAPAVAAGLRQAVGEAGGEGAGALGAQGVSPYSQGPEMAPVDYQPTKRSGVDRSPWLALMAAGAGMMSGSSPYAGVNIGEGIMAGTKALESLRTANQRDETLDQSARRLAQESAHHKDTFNLQKEQLGISRLNAEKEKWVPAGSVYSGDKVQPLVMNTGTGEIRNAVTNKPPTEDDKIIPPSKGGKVATPIDQGEARAVAEYFVRTGDQSRINSLGLTSEARQAVQSQVRQVQKELGITDEELATKRVEFEGRKAGQRTLGVMEARMGSAAIEAAGAIKLVRGLIERLPRTSFMPYNELRQKYDQKTLNPDQAELYARVQAIVNTYSAVMARGANITTDSSRHHAAELLNTAFDAPTFNRVLDTMLNEIDMAKNSPLKMREFYREMYGNPGDATKEKSKEKDTAPTSSTDKPKPTQADRDYVKKNPAAREKFIARFGVEP